MVATILEIPSKPSLVINNLRNWSATTLGEVENCPIRFVLRRSHYPSIWDKPGFPNRISTSQIKGIVVHNIVSKIISMVHDAPEDIDIQIMQYLKQNGGYLELIKKVLMDELSFASKNPRAKLAVDAISKDILDDLAQLRSQIQFFVKESLKNIKLDSHIEVSRKEDSGNPGTSIRRINSEFKIVDHEYPLEGYLDLLLINTDEDHIIDFKTSKQITDEYWRQLELYAWLWYRSPLNKRKGYCKIEVVSGSQTSESRFVTPTDIASIEKETLARLQNAVSAVSSENIRAVPSEDNCRFCTVKVVCDSYWKANENSQSISEWVDIRVELNENAGANVWKVNLLSDGSNAILVLGSKDDGKLKSGQEIRLLNAFISTDDEGQVIRLHRNTEIYRVLTD